MRQSFLFLYLSILGISIVLLSMYTSNYDMQHNGNSSNQDKIRGVWITYLELEEFSKKFQVNEHNYRKFISEIYDNCVFSNINHVYVHVRPFSDAIYPSKYYPWSHIITGTQGAAPDFDPLKIIVEEAHNRNLKVHAWINPYRVTNQEYPLSLDKNSKICKWIKDNKSRNVLEYNGQYYLNPANRAVKQCILNGIKEIIDHYGVDGIHFDDYFYPTFNKENYNQVFDSAEYENYKNNLIQRNKVPMSISKWRKNNVSKLVKNVYSIIQVHNKENNKKIVFGISPVGNIDSLRSDYQYYVDIDLFIKEKGYIDYICPQIYWGFEHPEMPFDKTLKRWIRLCNGSNVKLIIGIPVYKIGTNENDYERKEFKDEDVINKMLAYANKKGIKDVIYYRYNDLSKIQ